MFIFFKFLIFFEGWGPKWTGADLGISRGGRADFQKNFENFVDLFWFSERSQTTIKNLFRPKFLRRRHNFEKHAKNSENRPKIAKNRPKISTKKSRFFGIRSPLKISIEWRAEGAFRKILRSVSQKWISQNSTKGGPFGSAGGRLPEGGGERASASPPPPPKSATENGRFFFNVLWFDISDDTLTL